jgi:hypothetical protein
VGTNCGGWLCVCDRNKLLHAALPDNTLHPPSSSSPSWAGVRHVRVLVVTRQHIQKISLATILVEEERRGQSRGREGRVSDLGVAHRVETVSDLLGHSLAPELFSIRAPQDRKWIHPQQHGTASTGDMNHDPRRRRQIVTCFPFGRVSGVERGREGRGDQGGRR